MTDSEEAPPKSRRELLENLYHMGFSDGYLSGFITGTVLTLGILCIATVVLGKGSRND